MGRTQERLRQLRGSSPTEALRLIFRKGVYRRVRMGRYGYLARDAVAPTVPLELPIEVWGPERFDDLRGTNVYLKDEDIEHFKRQRSTCIVVLDGDEVAASSWMTSGPVFVSELGRTIEVGEHEHFSCRSWVGPQYRGLSLLSHMIYAYTRTLDPEDEVWGFVYYWNVASIKSLARIGWQFSGDYWTAYVFGVRFSGQTRTRPRPAFEGPDVFVP
jgi:hypothetical protein